MQDYFTPCVADVVRREDARVKTRTLTSCTRQHSGSTKLRTMLALLSPRPAFRTKQLSYELPTRLVAYGSESF